MGAIEPMTTEIGIDDLVSEFGGHVDAQAAAVFVGAGLSMLSGYPGWSQVVEPYLAALGLSENDARDFPLIVQYYEDAHSDGPQRVRDDIIAMVRERADAAPSAAHDRILSLPVHDIWTSNYDGLIEAAAAARGIELGVFRKDGDLVASKSVMRRLYKMHGSVEAADATQQLVISRDDFEHYPETHPRFWHLLRAHFLTRSFLFVGFSLSDPNIGEIFKMVRLQTPDVQRPHYAVLRRVDESDGKLAELRRRDLARVGVRIAEIDEHADVDAVLSRLVSRCRPPRLYISGSYNYEGVDASRVEAVAGAMVAELVRHEDIRLMTGGQLGGNVGYAVMRQRQASGRYDPDSLVVIRRAQDMPLEDAPNQRLGSMLFDGEHAAGLRSAAFAQVRAILVMGGGPRTRDEIQEAHELGMGVIPVAASRGAARAEWERLIADPDAYRLGERSVDPQTVRDLDSEDPGAVARAAVMLVRQGLSLS